MKRKTTKIERLMPIAFTVSTVTGIGLHVSGHGTSHDVWHNWAIAHILSSFIWLAATADHVWRHRRWYRSLATQGIGRKSKVTLTLSAVFAVVTVTGTVLLTCIDGANSAIGMWHYRLGLLLAALSVAHVSGHKRKRHIPSR